LSFNNQTIGFLFSKVFSIFFTIGILLASFVMFVVIKRGNKLSQGTQEYNDFQEKFGAISEGLNSKQTNLIASYWNLLTLIRWTATNFILIALRDYNFS
jgi:hypothetical protein